MICPTLEKQQTLVYIPPIVAASALRGAATTAPPATAIAPAPATVAAAALRNAPLPDVNSAAVLSLSPLCRLDCILTALEILRTAPLLLKHSPSTGYWLSERFGHMCKCVLQQCPPLHTAVCSVKPMLTCQRSQYMCMCHTALQVISVVGRNKCPCSSAILHLVHTAIVQQ